MLLIHKIKELQIKKNSTAGIRQLEKIVNAKDEVCAYLDGTLNSGCTCSSSSCTDGSNSCANTSTTSRSGGSTILWVISH